MIFAFVLLLVLPLSYCEELPDPHLIIMGATGTGKSSLANVLLGQKPGCENCTFPVCPGGDSCTKETMYAVGHWVDENGKDFTIVDTPGFGDSDNDDNELINEMIEVLKSVMKTANGFVLLFNGQSERFDTNAQQMIREMEALFGKGFWDHVVLGVSFWHFDSNSIHGRNASGKTEVWWTEEMNRQLKEKFHLERDLQAVFIDSWAKQDWNIDDSMQQEAYTRETTKLWNLFSTYSKFEFKTIQDVIEDLAECRLEIDCLSGEIQAELIRLANKDKELEDKNEEQDIKNEEQDIKIEEHDIKNEEQDTSIGNLDLQKLPLGTILPWVNKPQPDTLHHEELPDGWVLCNGTVISQGVWQGSKSPDLNNQGRFLRGGNPHEVLNIENHQIQDHTHVDSGHTHTDAGHNHDYREFYVDSHCGLDGCNGGPGLHTRSTEKGFANIQSSKSNIGTMESGSKGSETRPDNMRVIWILKAW